MRYILLPFQIIYKIYFLVVFALLMIIFFPFYYYLLAEPKRYPVAFKIMRFHVFVLHIFTGIFLHVKGAENIPASGAYVICPNHSSFLDAFCIYQVFHQYFVFTGKKEIEKWPLFHIFYTSGMNIMVDRHNTAGSFSALKRMTKELGKGNPLVIFPEGTRSKEAPKLAPFKPGAFAIAIQMQVPVLPVSFITNWKLLGSGGFFNGKAGPGISEIVIHKPILTTGMNKKDIDHLQRKTFDIISASLMR